MLWGSCILEIGDGIVFLQSMSPLSCGLQKPSILSTSQRTRFDSGFLGVSGTLRRKEAFCKSTGIRTLDRETDPPSQLGKEGWCACRAASGLPLPLVVDAPPANERLSWDSHSCAAYGYPQRHSSCLCLFKKCFFFLLWVTLWGQMPSVVGDAKQEVGRAEHSLIFSCDYFSSET